MKFDHQTLKLLFGIALRSDRQWRLRGLRLLRTALLILDDARAASEAYCRIPRPSDPKMSDVEAELMDRTHQYHIGYFLVALAVENLLKELYVLRHEVGEVTHIKKDVGDHFGHDQVRIAKECSFSLSPAEEELLSSFKEMAEWLGKYPVPIHLNAYREHMEKGSLSWTLFRASTDQDPLSPRVSAIIQRIISESDHEKGP